jgi:hypothetical protein
LKRIRIHLGIGRSLILKFSVFDDDVEWLKNRLPDLLQGKDVIPVKSSRFTTVLQFRHLQSGEIFYLKEFRDRGLKDKIKRSLGFLRSKRAFSAGEILLKNDFLSPLPVVYGMKKTLLFIKKDFLITKGVPGDRTYQYFQSRFHLPLSSEMCTEKRELLCAAGYEIGRLHGMGIFHGDLRVGNVIIDSGESSPRFYFIDNEKTRRYRMLPEKKRLKNLVQLNMVLLPHITMTDRLRFFNAYLSKNQSLLPEKKRLLREVYRMTKKRHESKRG